MRMLVIADKAMWVSVGFTTIGYAAATWVILPHGDGLHWHFVVIIAIGGDSIGTVFIGLTVILVEHCYRKSKWKKRTKQNVEEKHHDDSERE